MEEAGQVRTATREAVEGIEPERLREGIARVIDDGWMAPGALTLLSARAVVSDARSEALDRRAAGVQLIYEGLRLTRRLANENPWTTNEGRDAADVDVLVADVLVARGASILARTEAAGKAVEIIRAFGRDQTDRLAGSGSGPDRDLEGDVLELAAIAGTTAVTADPVDRMVDWADELAASIDGEGLPEEAILLSRADAPGGGTPVATSEGRTTSGTDP